MCLCRQVYYKGCGHLRRDWSHCKRFVAEGSRLRYRIFPCFFALSCPVTTTYIGWQDAGACRTCLGLQRVVDWICCGGGGGGGAPDDMSRDNDRSFAGGSRTHGDVAGADRDQRLSSASTSPTSTPRAGNVFGQPTRYSWLEMKPLPLEPKMTTAQSPRAPKGTTGLRSGDGASQEQSKTSKGDPWPEGMSTEEYMEEVELLWGAGRPSHNRRILDGGREGRGDVRTGVTD